jgi:Zn-dependent metalloprotease
MAASTRETPFVLCEIVPPQVLRRIEEIGDEEDRRRARRTREKSAQLRRIRRERRRRRRQGVIPAPATAEAVVRRVVYDMKHDGDERALPGVRARGEGDPDGADASVNQAYDGAGATFDLYSAVYERDSIDGEGMELISSVHFDEGFNNAFWDGEQMVYGDGDGRLFIGFTSSIDVIGHELTHGVTQHTAGLVYEGQPGALNESFSDVFGSLVKQRALGQTADQADWLIGEGILGPSLPGKALRSMIEPGTAYDGDTQPKDMDGYVELPNDEDDDFGGVHQYSSIPNRAFCVAATEIGGNAWEAAGRIWYATLSTEGRLSENADFREAARATVAVAGELFGEGSAEQQAVQAGWTEVKVPLT